ncbi:hypothetical protein K2173_010967 [Erythroxylum novogranatense]|uniref:Uncharacterized protein n=1 Tax=Erythroxylum novogranatense TaxID=1862640 RepID=A0AAV8T134_9ROSI|nr:hypothetical protein K2173_010967 [Erythroxylum novogranatense]
MESLTSLIKFRNVKAPYLPWSSRKFSWEEKEQRTEAKVENKGRLINVIQSNFRAWIRRLWNPNFGLCLFRVLCFISLWID